jgi:hypothetical protein
MRISLVLVVLLLVSTCWGQQEVIQELKTTEQTYINGLEELDRVYMQPLAQWMGDDFQRIFSSYTNLLNTVRPLAGTIQSSGFVGLVSSATFNSIAQAYSDFNVNFEMMLNEVTKRKTSAAWNAIKRSAGNAKEFDNLFITPIQRLPRYELLIREMMNKSKGGRGKKLDSNTVLMMNHALRRLQTIISQIDARIKQMADGQARGNHLQRQLPVSLQRRTRNLRALGGATTLGYYDRNDRYSDRYYGHRHRYDYDW